MSDLLENLRASLDVDYGHPGQPGIGGSCHGLAMQAIAEIERLTAALERVAFEMGDGETMYDAVVDAMDRMRTTARAALNRNADQPEAPPVNNDNVADGCEKFSE